MNAIVICCGNTLRGDDGVAAHVAALLCEQVNVLEVVQIQAEHADAIRSLERVAFVDASRDGKPGEIRCTLLEAVDPVSAFSHHLDPAELLALTRALYGARPEALQITITGEDFALQEGLSPAVAAAVPRVAEIASEWVRGAAGA